MKSVFKPVVWLACLCGLGVPVLAQGPSVSTQQLSFSIPQGGPLAPSLSFTVTASGTWTAVSSNSDLLTLAPAQGTGSLTVKATLVGWYSSSRAPGNYSTTITVSDTQSRTASVAVTLTVVSRQYPSFTYPAGPTGCADAAGLAPSNAALCTVPNQAPVGNFVPPSVGGSYVDPAFGGKVQVIAGPDSLHGYSTPSPVNAGNQYALVSVNGSPAIVQLLTGKIVRQGLGFGTEGTLWDSVQNNYLYWFSGATVQRYDVSSGKQTKIVDYSGAPYGFSSISSGGTGEMSKDNWFAFYAGQQRQACTLDLNTVTTYCAALPDAVKGVDYPTMAKGVDKVTGLRYVIIVPNDGSAFVVYSVNSSAHRLDLVGRGPENVTMANGNGDGICDPGESCLNGGHSDMMEDSAGNQVMVMAIEEQTPCGYSLYTVQINKGAQMGIPVEVGGGLKRVLPMFRCSHLDTWVDNHVGCAKLAPFCVISTTTLPFNVVRDPNDTTSPVAPLSAYRGEIMVMRDNGAELRRLAQHRSVQFSNEDGKGYWSAPRAAISEDGSYVIASSNFGKPNQHRVIVIPTGFGGPKIADGAVYNVAALTTTLAPGVLAAAYGSHLADWNCTASATLPLPEQLCGAKLMVAGRAAKLLYADSSQINFVVPEATPTNAPTDVQVRVTPDSGDPSATGEVLSDTQQLPAASMLAVYPALFSYYPKGSQAPATPTALLFDAGWNLGALRVGDYGIAFATGLGPTSPPVAEGDPAPLQEPLARVTQTLDVYINDVKQTVAYAGLGPGLCSVYQLVFQIDPGTPIRSDYNWIWINLNGVDSPRSLMTLRPATSP